MNFVANTGWPLCILGPAYNEQFDAQKCILSSRVLVPSEHFNINSSMIGHWLVLTELVVSGTQCIGARSNRTRGKRNPVYRCS